MVKFVNLSMSFLGILSNECSVFLDMMNDIGIDKKQPLYIIKKMINIAIRATYYIFCCRNRNWDSPDNAILSNRPLICTKRSCDIVFMKMKVIGFCL